MTARCEVRKLGMSRLMAGQVSAVVRGGHEWVEGLLDGQVKGGGGGEGQGRRVGGGEGEEGGHRKEYSGDVRSDAKMRFWRIRLARLYVTNCCCCCFYIICFSSSSSN